MRKNVFFLVVLLSFGGCATRPPAPASCDGTQRRPLNQTSHAGVFYPSCGADIEVVA